MERWYLFQDAKRVRCGGKRLGSASNLKHLPNPRAAVRTRQLASVLLSWCQAETREKPSIEGNCTPLLPTQCLMRNDFLAISSAFFKNPSPNPLSLVFFLIWLEIPECVQGFVLEWVSIAGIAECHLLHIWRNFLKSNLTLTYSFWPRIPERYLDLLKS